MNIDVLDGLELDDQGDNTLRTIIDNGDDGHDHANGDDGYVYDIEDEDYTNLTNEADDSNQGGENTWVGTATRVILALFESGAYRINSSEAIDGATVVITETRQGPAEVDERGDEMGLVE